MDRACLAGAGLLAFAVAVQPAGAQEIPNGGPSPAFNWTGLYVGAHAGRGWGSTKHCDEPDDACTPVFGIDGFIGGATVGLNWQYANWVLGLEADRSFGKVAGTVPSSLQFVCGAPCVTEIRGFDTIRGRVGAAFDRLLVYGTAGFAAGDLFGEVSQVTNADVTSGWTAGAGLEYALSPRLSLKLEYLHVRLGSVLSDPTGPYTTYGNFNVVRAGLNYRFAVGAAAPPFIPH